MPTDSHGEHRGEIMRILWNSRLQKSPNQGGPPDAHGLPQLGEDP